MNLYFQHSDGSYEYICPVHDVIDASNLGDAIKLALKDLHERNPRFQVYYIRTWKHENSFIMDVGSHTEFYVVKEG